MRHSTPLRDKRITVSSIWRTPVNRWRRNEKVAALRLSGEWLEQLGFKAGTTVLVTADRKRLVLTVEE
jgi:hypothetical protein